MLGVIRKRDILAHPWVTIESFGWQVFFRVLLAGRDQTFLAILAETGAMRSPPAESTELAQLIDRCVKLEARARQIYEQLAVQFAHDGAVAEFFRELAWQEHGHAELLKMCQAAASKGAWAEEQFAPCRETLPGLEREMAAATESLERIDQVPAALRLVLRIESSELNRVFKGIVSATDSKFVRSVQAFQAAGAQHLEFIRRQIMRFDPGLAEACESMRSVNQR
jgi:rubrerythrin